ncbi:PEP-CTERM sorting domain-containing protein [Denitrobaculum tricleocarpae]|uniref:PEP-CTERM sorting domain-containing protein n=1 Tax=Denitrobaculum tricleocarpae TaxID=2591009 RepID=A0A545TF32_9PROT|nr:PEP-CTERM sorting domain-containing protein [Denitrobaculum tricleocarpae]TQV75810.1 PEP-CTERM sorting domain-containing protein [Denitrobaculum tricleocarpae]
MRLFATNISAGLTATALAAATLAGIATVGLTPSPGQAATLQDHACAVTGGQCAGAAGSVFKNKKSRNLAAHALSNKVVMDVMLGHAKSNPDLTVGCGASGICVTLIPGQPSDPDHVGVPGILELTSDQGSGQQSFPSPSIHTAYLTGAPATRRFASRFSGGSGNTSGSPVAAQAFSTGPVGGPGSTPPGRNPGSPPGGPNDPGGPNNPGNPNNPGGPNNPGNPNNPGGQGPGDGPDDPITDPDTVFNPPFIDVDQPVEVIRVPEPSTLFIFGFALLAMAAFGSRQMQVVTQETRARR